MGRNTKLLWCFLILGLFLPYAQTQSKHYLLKLKQNLFNFEGIIFIYYQINVKEN